MNHFKLYTSRINIAFFMICMLLLTCANNVHAHIVVPIKISNMDYRFNAENCGIEMHVNPQIGGRVSALKFKDRVVITPYACPSPEYNSMGVCNGSGSTFWTSPQKKWTPATWPPIASIDGNPYSAQVDNNHLMLTGGNNETFGASVDKDFSIDDKACTINLRYTINASKAVQMAPWEITRVPRGGIAFFPVGDNKKLTPGPLAAFVTVTSNTNIAWFDDTTKAVPVSTSGAKLIADGTDGWLAYALGDTLFIKQFADATTQSTAPGEGDIEIYPGTDYLELEAQGTYTSLVSGGKLPWSVQWRVVQIPSTIKVAIGSDSLIEFVRKQLLPCCNAYSRHPYH